MNSRLPVALREFARSLRVHQTDAEGLLWLLLRNSRLGYKFRRQHPVGQFILDFYCHETHLAIELDGGQHNDDAAAVKDKRRTAELEHIGIRIIRFWDDEILISTEAVLEKIYQELVDRAAPHPYPAPRGRGDS